MKSDRQMQGTSLAMEALKGRRLIAVLFAALFLVSACAGRASNGASQGDILDPLRTADFSPPPQEEYSLKPESVSESPALPSGPQRQVFLGNDNYLQDASLSSAQGAQKTSAGVQVNFDKADLREVVRAIMGDILGLDFVLDPRVQGSVTITTGGPIAEDDLLATLEMLLRMNNAALLLDQGLYRVIPAAEAVAEPSVRQLGDQDEPPLAGYGLTVVPLRYVSAGTMVQLLDNVVARQGALRADLLRNIMIISGTSRERQSILSAVRSFDVDWLAGQSAGIFPLTNSTPDVVIPELEQVFQASGDGLGSGLIAFQPVERLNAVLVVSKRSTMLRDAEKWIDRLDQANALGTNLFVYYVENGKAEDLANILNDAFTDVSADSEQQRRVAPSLDPVVASASQSASVAGSDAQAATLAPARSVSVTTTQATVRRGARSDVRSDGRVGGGSLSGVGPIRVIADPVNNALLILATRGGYDLVRAALRQIDVRPLQVLIDATIAEVTLNDQLRFGVQWFLESGHFSGGFSSGAALSPAAAVPGFNFIFDSSNARVVIDALSSVSDVKVLSAPSVVVLDNQSATLEVGDEVPIATRQQQGTDSDSNIINNIEFRDTGVILNVMPRINSSGLVTMEIEQEVSSVANQVEGGTLTPTISQRRVKSTIAVRSGQTVVLGGLINERQSKSDSGIPGLRELPLVGNLFGTQDDEISRTELIIFITPRVIRDEDDAQAIAEELRRRMRSLSPVDGSNDPAVPDEVLPQKTSELPEAGPVLAAQ